MSHPPLTGLGLAALLSAPFLSVMGAFSVIVAAPAIGAGLGAGPGDLSAIVAGYGVAYAAMLIPGGRLGDIYGHRRMLIAGLLAFTLAGLACAAAPDTEVLIVARLLQGVAAAIAFPQTLSIIRLAARDDAARARGFAAFGIALGLSGIAGQVVAGAAVAADIGGLSWRLVFLVNLPVALVACPVIMTRVPATRAAVPPRLDLGGAILAALGFGLLLRAVIAASAPTAVAAVIVLAGFCRDQRRKTAADRAPLVPTTMLGEPGFAWGLVAALLFHTTVVAFPYVLALFLQLGLGFDAWTTGLMGLPTTVAFLIASLALARRTGLALMAWGGGLATLGLALCAAGPLVLPGSGLGLLPGLVVMGLGQGCFLPPLLNVVLARTSPANAGAGAGVVATAQQLGGAFGVAAVSALFFAGDDRVMAFGLAVAAPALAALAATLLLPVVFRRRLLT